MKYKYIIDFKNEVTDKEIDLYISNLSGKVIKEFNQFDKTFLIECDKKPTISEIVDHIIDDTVHPIVLLGDIINTDRYYGTSDPLLPATSISTGDNKDWWKNYVLEYPEFDKEEVVISRRGSGITVYIMDSGILKSHPDFTETDIRDIYSVSDTTTDTSGHGTAICSVIAGKECGLTSATIKNVKIFQKNYSTKQSDMLSALDAILSDYLADTNSFGIVNCSWSIPKNLYIEEKIKVLLDAGLCFIAAAGNNGVPITDVTPGSMDGVLTIGAYNQDFLPCNFSNYSNTTATSLTKSYTNSGQIDGWAPGEDIYVATLDGLYSMSAGTSLSAAIHSCVLAYNLSARLNNGILAEISSDLTCQLMSNLSLSRTNMLDLSDPKYSESVNRISTLANRIDLSQYVTNPFNSMAVHVNSKKTKRIFNPQEFIAYEIVKPLPLGFSITTNGILIGSPTTVSGMYEYFTSLVKVYKDNETSILIDLALGILAEDYDRSLVPADDPILDITLLAVNCTEDPVIPPGNPTPVIGCTDDCNSAGRGTCIQGSKGAYTCYCSVPA